MVNMRIFSYQHLQKGSALLEVLVTIVILATGLLGIAGLQLRLQVSEMGAYQRAQALILLNDMSSRITANRNNAASYVTATPLGVGMTCPTSTATQQARDTSEWCSALQGAAEKIGAANVGVMVGGRGCVQSIAPNLYMITVAWQGLVPISAPPASVTCGKDLYNATEADAKCVNDLCRVAITRVVRIAQLGI